MFLNGFQAQHRIAYLEDDLGRVNERVRICFIFLSLSPLFRQHREWKTGLDS